MCVHKGIRCLKLRAAAISIRIDISVCIYTHLSLNSLAKTPLCFVWVCMYRWVMICMGICVGKRSVLGRLWLNRFLYACANLCVNRLCCLHPMCVRKCVYVCNNCSLKHPFVTNVFFETPILEIRLCNSYVLEVRFFKPLFTNGSNDVCVDLHAKIVFMHLRILIGTRSRHS